MRGWICFRIDHELSDSLGGEHGPKPTATRSMTVNGTVFLHGEWIVVPADTVISGPNKLGKAIVWFQKPGELAWGGNTSTPILCFIPGSEV